MKTGINNEMKTALILFKDFFSDYNANNLSKKMNLSSMGTLKILKKLKSQNIITSKKMGKAVFYKINFNSNYAKNYLRFILQKEAEESAPRIKRWVKELRPLENNSEVGILFGSILNKEDFKDVDFIAILNQSQSIRLNEQMDKINKVNIKKIHVIKQTKEDYKKNIKKRDKIILDSIKKGVVIFGYDKIIKIIENVTL